jgi:ABC-type oligopeptide transport system substrate-binding subunit
MRATSRTARTSATWTRPEGWSHRRARADRKSSSTRARRTQDRSEHVVSALRGLGYRARLKTIAAGDYFTEIEKAGGSHIQAGFVGWIAAIPSPAEYFQSLLDYLGDVAGYSDKQVSAEVAHALELQQTDLAAANEVWARVDRLLTDRDYLVPLYNPRANAFVSERVGNYQFHLFNYVLLDQLWVR